MTEAEIMSQLMNNGSRVWSITQYWTGISFTVIAASHLTRGQVSAPVTTCFLLFYVLFSIVLWEMTRFDMAVIRGAIAELRALADSGHTLGATATAFLENAPLAHPTTLKTSVRAFSVYGMFLMTLAYPLYCQLKYRREASRD